MSSTETGASQLNERLATSGLRPTTQRQHVYDVLLHKPDHPTAEEIFLRAKQTMPDISIATVYNCLDALVKCDLVKSVSLERGAKRFCPNMDEHFHFLCETCNRIFDITALPTPDRFANLVPQGFRLNKFELSLRGTCAECAAQKGTVR